MTDWHAYQGFLAGGSFLFSIGTWVIARRWDRRSRRNQFSVAVQGRVIAAIQDVNFAAATSERLLENIALLPWGASDLERRGAESETSFARAHASIAGARMIIGNRVPSRTEKQLASLGNLAVEAQRQVQYAFNGCELRSNEENLGRVMNARAIWAAVTLSALSVIAAMHDEFRLDGAERGGDVAASQAGLLGEVTGDAAAKGWPRAHDVRCDTEGLTRGHPKPG